MALLEIRGLSHRFQQNKALDEVSLTVEAGEVHALVGENGAGKSTLIKLLGGIYPWQQGELLWQGEPLTLTSPQQSLAAGIQIIHQERQLIPSFTAAENMVLGLAHEQRGFRIRRRQMEAKCQALVDEWGIHLDVRQPASALSPAEKTMVEVARVLLRPCRLLILDEPTASLTDRETAVLFNVIERLRQQGTAILYVSHRLEEVFRLSQHITVLRNGRRAATLATAETSKAQLIRLMTMCAWSSHSSTIRLRAKRCSQWRGSPMQPAWSRKRRLRCTAGRSWASSAWQAAAARSYWKVSTASGL